MMRLRKRSRPAFTLIELLVVVAIVAVLVGIVTPSLRQGRALARAASCRANLHGVAVGFRQYLSAFGGEYPYGVPRPAETMQHPHYQTWMPDGTTRGGGTPPQQQFWDLAYNRSTGSWVCPADPHPEDYRWWDYSVHPNFRGGSSYMFSEQALFGVTWWTHRIFRQSQVIQPATFALAADGWMCPNGWQWSTVDPGYELHRIDWSHGGEVNFLFGDDSVHPRPQDGAGVLIRTNPLHLDPRHTSQ